MEVAGASKPQQSRSLGYRQVQIWNRSPHEVRVPLLILPNLSFAVCHVSIKLSMTRRLDVYFMQLCVTISGMVRRS